MLTATAIAGVAVLTAAAILSTSRNDISTPETNVVPVAVQAVTPRAASSPASGERLKQMLTQAVMLSAQSEHERLGEPAPKAAPRQVSGVGERLRRQGALRAPMTQDRLERSGDEMLAWQQRQAYSGTHWGHEATSALVNMHRGIYHKLAWRAVRRYPGIGDKDDFFQNAVVGGMTAYDSYNPAREGAIRARLSTHVYLTVSRYLQDSADGQDAMYCPRQRRADRAYARGEYDANPAKKEAYEARYSPEEREAIREEIAPLIGGITSLDAFTQVSTSAQRDTVVDRIPSPQALTEDQVVTHLEMSLRREGLTEVQREIQMMMNHDGMNTGEVAEAMGLTQNQVRVQIRKIREHMGKYQAADVQELVAMSG